MASRSLTRPAPRRGPGRREGSTRPSSSSSPVKGRSASSRCPSRSTQSTSDASCAAGAMPSSDSIMQPSITRRPEGARGVHHPHRLAQPAALGQLDVDPVRVARRSRPRRRGRGSPRRPPRAGAAAARAARGRSRGPRPGRAARSARRRARRSAGTSSRAVLERPALVGVHAQRRVGLGRAPPRSRARSSAPPDLDLERPEAARPARAVACAVERVDADRVRGGRGAAATARAGARPARPSRRPIQSCSAASSAARPAASPSRRPRIVLERERVVAQAPGAAPPRKALAVVDASRRGSRSARPRRARPRRRARSST